MRLWLVCFFVLTGVGCNRQQRSNPGTVNIHLSKDSQSVVITGFEHSLVAELSKDTTAYITNLLRVYRMPKDTEILDLEQQQYGTYKTTDDNINFKPDTPFAKHQLYVVRFYGSSTNYSLANLVRSKTNLRGIPFTEIRFQF